MLSTPETLEDNQALLDRTYNVTANNSISGEISSDDIYILDSDYNTLSNEFEKDCIHGSQIMFLIMMRMTGEAVTEELMFVTLFYLILIIIRFPEQRT